MFLDYASLRSFALCSVGWLAGCGGESDGTQSTPGAGDGGAERVGSDAGPEDVDRDAGDDASAGSTGTPLTGAVQVAVTNNMACAVLEDGHVWCWGNDQNGELGDGEPSAAPSIRAQEVPDLEGVIAIATAAGGTCAVLEAGGMVCWGSSQRVLGFAGLGLKVPTPAVVPGAEDAVDVRLTSISLGFRACTLDRDDTVHCFRANGVTERPPVTCLSDVASMPTAGLALTNERQAIRFSDDGTGGCTLDILPELEGASALALGAGFGGAGAFGVCGILDGRVSCSSSANGALALTEVDLPGPAIALDKGTDDRRCALLDSDELWCWGGTAMRAIRMDGPRRELSGDVVDFSVAMGEGCAVLADTTVQCWGTLEPAAPVMR